MYICISNTENCTCIAYSIDRHADLSNSKYSPGSIIHVSPSIKVKHIVIGIYCLFYEKLKEHCNINEICIESKFCIFFAFHSKRVWLDAQPVLWCHYQSRQSIMPWNIAMRHDVWREIRRFISRHMISLDQSYFFICHINYMRYNNIHLLPSFKGDKKISSTKKMHVSSPPGDMIFWMQQIVMSSD